MAVGVGVWEKMDRGQELVPLAGRDRDPWHTAIFERQLLYCWNITITIHH
jgi:hypothetical protein